jgi:hypothetical protein
MRNFEVMPEKFIAKKKIRSKFLQKESSTCHNNAL